MMGLIPIGHKYDGLNLEDSRSNLLSENGCKYCRVSYALTTRRRSAHHWWAGKTAWPVCPVSFWQEKCAVFSGVKSGKYAYGAEPVFQT
ncbi:MAG: hypothetical protein MI975_03460 [Cytophagales bacterium]|nr:hypothetical protein [Cytophagales bacterium]